MQPKIVESQEKKLVGMFAEMTLAENKTFELFSAFMPRRKEIEPAVSAHIYDARLYPKRYFNPFQPTRPFTKWAAIEVTNFQQIPKGMDALTLPGGLYAVFHSNAETHKTIFEHIFMHWLPISEYKLSDRPHFDILTETPQRHQLDTEQEIWIPVKEK